MVWLTNVLATGLLVWLSLLALLVSFRALRGDIKVAGILAHRLDAADGGQVVPERIVAMIVFPFVLLVYTLNALQADVGAAGGAPSLPDVPEYLLSLLTGGNGLYLAGKIARNS
jgi:hypothetical protein